MALPNPPVLVAAALALSAGAPARLSAEPATPEAEPPTLPRLLPPARGFDRPTAPRAAEPEMARRPLELGGGVFTSFADCTAAGGDCTQIEPALVASMLWRSTPGFAVGASAEHNVESVQASPGWALRLSLLGRAYFADSGPLEPFAELGVGAAHYARQLVAGLRQSSTGLLVRGQVGLDVHLSGRLRFGPALSWSELLVQGVQHCPTGAACRSVPAGQAPVVRRFVQLGAQLTLALGDPM